MKMRVAVAMMLAVLAVAMWFPTKRTQRSPWSPHFAGLGDLPGGSFYSVANGVSADGSVVVGDSSSPRGIEAFRWQRGDGIASLKFAHASAVSGDGLTVVGHATAGGRTEPVRWTPLERAQIADTWPELNGASANDVSASGDAIVGSAAFAERGAGRSEAAFLWSARSGFARLKHKVEISIASDARAISSDGSVVAGVVRLEAGHNEAFRWSSQSGFVRLGFLPGHTTSVANGISADGSIIVGRSGDHFHSEAFRWTEETGMVGLGSLRDLEGEGAAFDVSADGSVIVGFCTGRTGWEAFVWNSARGMRSIRDVLEHDLKVGAALLGWNLRLAKAVSEDGGTVVGVGVNPQGNYEAWIARIDRQALGIARGTVGAVQARSGGGYFGIGDVSTSGLPLVTSTLSSMRTPPTVRQRSR